MVNDDNNYIIKMTSKNSSLHHEERQFEDVQRQLFAFQSNKNHPIRSPSPDPKSNIITPTRSPELIDIKRQLTPIKHSTFSANIIHNIQQIQHQALIRKAQSKPHQEILPPNHSKSNDDQGNLQTSSKFFQSRKMQERGTVEIQISDSRKHQDILDGEWQHQKYQELDYVKLLREKQETIRELHEIIEMMNRNKDWDEKEVDECKTKQGWLDYSRQVKILTIENQKLINVIQNNNVNISSNKEEILQREIREQRETIREMESHTQQLTTILTQQRLENQHLQHQSHTFQAENDKLIQIIHNNLQAQNSNLIKTTHDPFQGTARMSLSMIKEQYEENVKLMKENMEAQLTETEHKYLEMLGLLDQRIHQLEANQFKIMQNKQHYFNSSQQEIQKLICCEQCKRYEHTINRLLQSNQELSRQSIAIHPSNVLTQSPNKQSHPTHHLPSTIHSNNHSLTIHPTLVGSGAKDATIIEEFDLSERDEVLENLAAENQQLKLKLEQVIKTNRENIIHLQETIWRPEHVEKQGGQEQISHKQEQISHKQEQIIEMEGKLAKANQEFAHQEERYRIQISNLENQLLSLKEETQSKLTILVDNYQQECEVLKSQISRRNQEIARMQNEMQRYEVQIQNHEILQTEADSFKMHISQREDQIRSLGDQVKELRNGEAVRQSQVQQLQDEITIWNSNLEKKHCEMEEVIKTVSNKEAEIQKLEHEILALNKNYDQERRRFEKKEISWEGEKEKMEKKIQDLSEVELIGRKRAVQHDRMMEELKKIRGLINQYDSINKDFLNNSWFQEQKQIIILFQTKIQENHHQAQQIQQLRSIKNKNQQEILILKEKISFLEQNINIYERQLEMVIPKLQS